MIKISDNFKYLWKACNKSGTVLCRLCPFCPPLLGTILLVRKGMLSEAMEYLLPSMSQPFPSATLFRKLHQNSLLKLQLVDTFMMWNHWFYWRLRKCETYWCFPFRCACCFVGPPRAEGKKGSSYSLHHKNFKKNKTLPYKCLAFPYYLVFKVLSHCSTGCTSPVGFEARKYLQNL